ncbi:MAG: iron-containing redox enzyme family protein [Proteobacteria bacterium]|nr:iron-containing redox enzyme family protein [Pseudomonadota bacterium]
MNLQEFESKVTALVEQFPTNRLMTILDQGAFTMSSYHALLLTLFHQVQNGPGTFALAGAMLPPHLWEARHYLLHHADEEKTHWQWILNDLEATGYAGSDPRETAPRPACAAYIAYNYYIALRNPIARLAIASVLEGFGARYGKLYATKLAKALSLRHDQLQFFFGHGDTDVGHTQEIFEVLGKSNLSEVDWCTMIDVAGTASALYRAMYDQAVPEA